MTLVDSIYCGFRVGEILGVEDQSQVGALLDSSFGLNEGCHYFDDFPIWNFPLSRVHGKQFGFFARDLLAASASVRIAEIRRLGRSGLQKVGMIGAVATLPSFRGRGLASELVKRTLDWARIERAEYAVLWTGQPALYERLGFRAAGSQSQIPLAHLCSQLAIGSSPVSTGWTPALFDLIRERACGVQLLESDRTWYSAHRNVEWFYTGSAKEPRAYAAMGRGIDLGGYVHEWGGDPFELGSVFQEIAHSNPSALLLGHPSLIKGWLPNLAMKGTSEALCYLADLRTHSVNPTDTFDDLWIWGLDAV